MLNIPDEVARVVSSARWYAMDRDDQGGLLDWLYELESMLTHEEPQDRDRAEEAFEDPDCFCNGGSDIPAR